MITKMYNVWYDIKERIKDKKGQGMVEYALILGLVAVVVIGLLTTMGTDIKAKFQEIVNAI